MKATTLCILWGSFVLFVSGCGQNRESAEADFETAKQAPVAMDRSGGEGASIAMAPPSATDSTTSDISVSSAPVSSSAAVETGRDSTRRFIRTANLKFRAVDAIEATYRVEDIVGRLDGFVTSSQLNGNIDYQTTIPISADSSLETTYYTVVGTMTVRVPNTKLDSALKAIAPLVDFLDYRTVTASDVSITMLENELERRRLETHGQRLRNAIDSRGRKLESVAATEDNLLNKQASADNALISNLTLKDQIEFSRIDLSIYQKQTFRREVIPNDRNIEAYEPGLGTQIVDALHIGWRALVFVLVFLTKIWALILFGIVVYVVYRKFRRGGETK